MYSGTTTHYNLPQYVANDIPSILGDLNGAYSDIDDAIYGVASTAATADTKATTATENAGTALTTAQAAQTDATQALSDAANAQADATQALSDASSASTAASAAVTTANTALSTAQTASNTASSAASDASAALTAAQSAASDASTALSTANSANTTAGNALTTAQAAQTSATSASTAVAAVQSEIGDTPLPTTAQTITGAIDELYNSGGGGGGASEADAMLRENGFISEALATGVYLGYSGAQTFIEFRNVVVSSASLVQLRYRNNAQRTPSELFTYLNSLLAAAGLKRRVVLPTIYSAGNNRQFGSLSADAITVEGSAAQGFGRGNIYYSTASTPQETYIDYYCGFTQNVSTANPATARVYLPTVLKESV